MGPHPAVAAIRLAVRRVLHDILDEQSAPHAELPRPELQTAHAQTPHAAQLPYAPHSPYGDHAQETTPSPGPRTARLSGQPPLGVPTPSRGRRIAARAPQGSQAAHERPPSPVVLVACSGGADSMALASALAFEAPKLGVRAGGITVDHGLQAGSDLRADEVAQRLRELGLDPVEAVAVAVGRDGGPEAAARDARYAALDAAAERHGAAAILLGHTRDDQAETVLLGLARGSGTRSLSGMAAVSGAGGRYRRPFLHIDRQTARKACMAQSLPVWDDPHNTDPAYTRSRLRHEGLPALEKALGKGVVEALARTAQLSRDDADALDAWAGQAEAAVRDDAGCLECAKLHALPPAVRRRVLRRAAIDAGAPAGSLFARHIEEVDRLITGWRGQGAINLPGKVVARRQGGRLVIRQG
ncbi:MULTISPECIES: tRNA lysidine(34) synthetase TilS [unclassified Streptomyces]|uniref:tRNA lysidine(34) synthetase TilS n=1 Tax=unclassified Streptomyces TaxID=2593676 RepID=UPI002740794C|nr:MULTISPECIES: tRNA lysidine(34) synthetase TilS [unclassified Streptomyces]